MQSPSTILGLDIGAESVGWSLLEQQEDRPRRLIAAGARVFDAAVEGDYETGNDVSRAAARRKARMPRRQNWRRQWRKQKLLRILQRIGLLPTGDISRPEKVHEFLKALDDRLKHEIPAFANGPPAHTAPYELRRIALDEKLEPEQLGRALYHLAQRRGFLSNRKTDRADSESGVVKEAIASLDQEIKNAGARTLGEYFAGLDPTVERIRRRWTSREMYEDEFEAICSKQAQFHPTILTSENKSLVHGAIFFQRPLKSQKHLIGRCSLMPTRRRAPLALRIAQRFRILQKVNDLGIREDVELRALTDEERKTVLSRLTEKEEVTFSSLKAKKLLNLPKSAQFSPPSSCEN